MSEPKMPEGWEQVMKREIPAGHITTNSDVQAYMQDEIDALRALCEQHDKYQAELRDILRLQEKEIERIVDWNHRVSVCANHTEDIVDGDCVVCAKEQAEERADRLVAALTKIYDFTTGYDDIAGIVNKISREAITNAAQEEKP